MQIYQAYDYQLHKKVGKSAKVGNAYVGSTIS